MRSNDEERCKEVQQRRQHLSQTTYGQSNLHAPLHIVLARQIIGVDVDRIYTKQPDGLKQPKFSAAESRRVDQFVAWPPIGIHGLRDAHQRRMDIGMLAFYLGLNEAVSMDALELGLVQQKCRTNQTVCPVDEADDAQNEVLVVVAE